MTIRIDNDRLKQQILGVFPQATSPQETPLIKSNLYGFAKALIKAKLETDGDLYASKGRKIQNNS